MRFIFDMDGTLVDSRLAVIQAYKMAGVNMPTDAWGKPWFEWGVTAEQHDTKNRLYLNSLRQYGRRLPTADLLELVGGTILTSASASAVCAVSEFLGLPLNVIGCSVSASEKISILMDEARSDRVIYVDDDYEFGINTINIGNVSFLHVTEHEGVFNLWQKRKGRSYVQRWTISGWFDRPPIETSND